MTISSQVNESLLKERLSVLASASSLEPRILSDLETFVRTADDYDLFRVNPIQYGNSSGLSETDAIDLFIHAAKAGIRVIFLTS